MGLGSRWGGGLGGEVLWMECSLMGLGSVLARM